MCQVFLLALAFGTSVHAADTALTIYSKATPGSINPDMYRPVPGRGMGYGYGGSVPGYAMVRHVQPMTLTQGTSTHTFDDVAAYLDPTTVVFRSLTNEKTRVVEQNFLFDLVNRQKLLQKYIDKTITVEVAHGDSIERYTGTLLSTDGGLTLQEAGRGLRVLNTYSNIKLPDLPEGLRTQPTLEWQLWSPQSGEQNVEVAYQTGGLTWWADYNLTFTPGEDANSGTLDVGAWVSIINQSGATYDDAKLKLMAGDVQRAQPKRHYQQERMMAMSAMDTAPAAFDEKAFFEYHLYTLPRPATLRDNSTQQMALFDAVNDVPVEKVLHYYGSQSFYGWGNSPNSNRDYGVTTGNKKIDVYLKFKNSADIGLGKPMPAGRIRVNQRDTADGSLEFIGEDTIDHTPKNEEVMIKLGSAFDVVGERTQTNFYVDHSRKIMTESFDITLKNHKEQAVKVVVKENLYRWSNWSITKSSMNYDKKDSRTITFTPTIPADGEVTISYTVTYTW